MQAVVIDQFGEPGKVLHAATVPTPDPGAGEVRVAMTYSPIHNHDLAIVRGIYGYRPPLPAIPGTEAVGVIEAVGEGVSGLELGTRVAVAGARSSWADYFIAPAAGVVPVPQEVPDETAAQLFAMPLSALILLDDLHVLPGQWVAINAANGAVGRLFNLFAQQRGVRVVSLVRGAASVAALTEQGYGPVIDTTIDGWGNTVVEATAGEPIVRAIDQVSGVASTDLMALLAPRGELISFGALSGEPMIIPSGPVIFKETVVRGFWGQQRNAELTPQDRIRLMSELVAFASSGVLRMDAQAIFDLAQAAEAAVLTETPGRTGKVMLRGGVH
ncbi:zinc-binding dehydrogenase [Nocardia camponoti]|uniref:Alcohol dehydrogenase n=1 Tax=Nocardia camponoti TaxID=1616106 RepID=A0A917V4Z3_9NOCA|nr:zinc-binding dehydrogenase [Nocardia camponoti]GGK38156.1 alcohol dehydrogenase [Nocardia camponoti]